MEVAHRRRPVVMLLLCLLLSDVARAFVLDRHAKEANELAEALKVIQRAKRRLLDEAIEPEAGYYWQDEAGSPFRNEVADNEVLEDLFAEEPEDSFLAEPGWKESDIPEQEVLEPGTEEVDKAELENMFVEGNTEKREYDPSQEVEKKDDNRLSDAEVANLLDTAKETEVKVISEGDSKTPVAKEEIKQVLTVGEPDGNGNEKVKIKEDNWLITPENTMHNSKEDEKLIPEDEVTNVNKEWLMDFSEPLAITVKKKKRSNDPVLAESAARERAQEDAEEENNMEYLKEFIELEEDENNNLANALNLATLSQVERTDKYIPLEVEYLKQSIKDEETIQNIKESLGISQGEEESDDEEEELDKEEVEDILEPEEVNKEEELVADFGEVAQDDINEVLSQKLRQFLYRTALANRQRENGFMDNTMDNFDQKEYELNPFLRELIQQMYKNGVSKRGQVDEIDTEGQYGPFVNDLEEDIPVDEVEPEEPNSLFPLQKEECPSVTEYVDNCAYVRSLGMGLDDEALDLCNRHQLCYSCGAYYGMSADTCDKGYLGEADVLCKGDEDCKDEAAGLYFFMLKDHKYNSQRSNGFSCAAQCTYNYILGLE